MKRVLLLTLAVMFCASAAAADYIGLFADQTGTSCLVTPTPGVAYSVYVVHKQNAVGATGSFFALDDQTGEAHSGYTPPPGMTPLGDPWVGGISIGYGDCKIDADLLILTLNYTGSPGAAPTCSRVKVIAHTLAVCPGIPGQVCYTDCDFNELPAPGGTAWFNSDGTCTECIVGTEAKTWGAVKALYR